jgi:hypothetical protein
MQTVWPSDCETISAADFIGADWSGWVAQDKKDGVRAVLHVCNQGNALTGRRPETRFDDKHPHIQSANLPMLDGAIFDGELMPDGTYWVFDLPTHDGKLSERLAELNRLAVHFPSWMRLVESVSPTSEAFAESKEGIVLKRLGAKYGRDWLKLKHVETYDVTVMDYDAETKSAGVALDGKQCGRVFNVTEPLTVGEIIEVKCQERFESGCFRHGRFIRRRPDKM